MSQLFLFKIHFKVCEPLFKRKKLFLGGIYRFIEK